MARAVHEPGFSLDSVDSRSLGFLKIMQRRYDVLLCDLTLRSEAGMELLREIRTRGDRTPALLLVNRALEPVVTNRAQTLTHATCRIVEELEVAELSRELRQVADRCAPTADDHEISISAVAEADSQTASEGRERGSSACTESAPVLLWKADANGQFTRFNRAWSRFVGRSDEKELGLGWTDALHADDAERFSRLYPEVLASRIEFTVDLRLCARDGDFRWIRMRGVPRFDSAGKFRGYIGSAFEIGDLKQGLEISEGRVRQLSRESENLESFVQAALHDLHEPLRTLEHDLQSFQGERAEQARQNVQRLQTLLRDLQDCQYVALPGERLEPIEMSQPLDWALQNLRAPIERSDARVTHDPMPVVRADSVQFARVLQNLIGNAIKFRREDSVMIHIGVTQSDGEWCFWVQDNGRGIDAEARQAIFEPFTRMERLDSESRGLGLTICKKIVERHGGRIWVQSSVGEGSTFFFTLPS